MGVTSIRDVEALVERAQRALASFRELREEGDKQLVPPTPDPLTLTSLEEWLVAARDAVRRPQIARSTQLLRDAGFDPSVVPAEVLGDPSRVSALIQRTQAMPEEVSRKAARLVGRALTKSLSEAEVVADAFVEVARALVLEIEHACPAVDSLLLQSVPEVPAEHEEYVTNALRIRELLAQPLQRGVKIGAEATSVDELLRDLSSCDSALKDLDVLILREGLSPQDAPQVKGRTLRESRELYEQKKRAILGEKEALKADHHILAARLRLLATASDPAPDKLIELRTVVTNMRNRLATRYEELVRALGTEAALFVESALSGTLPPATALTDAKLGEAIRKVVSVGFRLRMEAPSENQ